MIPNSTTTTMSPPFLPRTRKKLPYTRYGPVRSSSVPIQDAPEGLRTQQDEDAWIGFWNEIGDACSKLGRFSKMSMAFYALAVLGLIVACIWRIHTHGELSWEALLVAVVVFYLLRLYQEYMFSLFAVKLAGIQSMCTGHNLAHYHVEVHYECPGGPESGLHDGCYVYFYQPCATLQEEAPGMLRQNGYLRVEIAKNPSWFAPPTTSLTNYDYVPQGFENLAADWAEFWSQIDVLASNFVTILRKSNLLSFAYIIFVLPVSIDKGDETNETAAMVYAISYTILFLLCLPLICLQYYYFSFLQSFDSDLDRILKEFEENFESHGVAVEYRKQFEPSSFHYLGSGSTLQHIFNFFSLQSHLNPNLHRYIYLFPLEATSTTTTSHEALV